MAFYIDRFHHNQIASISINGDPIHLIWQAKAMFFWDAMNSKLTGRKPCAVL
jgi:hypothetical protein